MNTHSLLGLARTDRSSLGSGWTLERPSLPYQRAFDYCAVEAQRVGGPVAVLASSPFYARELVRRLSADVLLSFTRNPVLDEAQLPALLGPEVSEDRVHLEAPWQRGEGRPPRTVVWAEPERETWKAALAGLAPLAPRAARFCVLGTTRLRRLLPEWQPGASLPAQAPLGSLQHVCRLLRDLGYPAQQIYGFHGPLSMVWGAASRLPATLGSDDLVDRCFAAMRMAYVACGWPARWAPVWMVVASPGEG